MNLSDHQGPGWAVGVFLLFLAGGVSRAEGFVGGAGGSDLFAFLALIVGIPALLAAMLVGALLGRVLGGRSRMRVGARWGAAVMVLAPFALTDDWTHDSAKLASLFLVSAILSLLAMLVLKISQWLAALRRPSLPKQASREREAP